MLYSTSKHCILCLFIFLSLLTGFFEYLEPACNECRDVASAYYIDLLNILILLQYENIILYEDIP